MSRQQIPDPAAEVDRPSTDPEEWVERYGDFLFRYALMRVRNEMMAEELVQETFLAGLRFGDQYAGHGTQRAWLLSILRRKISDHFRRRSRQTAERQPRRWTKESGRLFDEEGNWTLEVHRWSPPDRQMQFRELWDIISECLTTLPDTQADVFVLSVLEEMETEEICRQLEISRTNVWSRLHRARLGLARCVGSRWFTGEGTRHVD